MSESDIKYPPAKQKRDRSLRVICVKWGDKYPLDYVEKLANMCERHLPLHEFVCVTDDPPSLSASRISFQPLVCDLPGWWQKVGLFRPGMFPGHNLFLDLDVVITESLRVLVEQSKIEPTKLYTLDDFSYSLRNPRPLASLSSDLLAKLGGVGTINSSVMAWHGWPDSEVYKAWKDFDAEVMNVLHGDQNWITRALWPDSIRFFADGFVKSYKYGGRTEAPLVVFHGSPKPHEVNDTWVQENWQ